MNMVVAHGITNEKGLTYSLWSWASGSLVWGNGNQYAVTSIPLDIREMYMYKYFEHGRFYEARVCRLAKII